MSTSSWVTSIIDPLSESELILRRYLVHLNLTFLTWWIYVSVIDLLSCTITAPFRSHYCIFLLLIWLTFIWIFIALNIQCLYNYLACVTEWSCWSIYFHILRCLLRMASITSIDAIIRCSRWAMATLSLILI